MIVSLEEIKNYLRVDYNDEDPYIQELIQASELYLKNVTGKVYDSTNPLAKLYCKALITDWFENRGLISESGDSDKVRHTLQDILSQLQYTVVQ